MMKSFVLWHGIAPLEKKEMLPESSSIASISPLKNLNIAFGLFIIYTIIRVNHFIYSGSNIFFCKFNICT